MSEKAKSFYEQELDRMVEAQSRHEYLYIQVRQSRAFIEKYHAEKIALDDMAAAAFMSRFHYIRIFQQVYGVTPRQYLQDRRIAKAKELLRQGLSVTEVCLAVGYESLPSFSRRFKQGTGSTPSDYRQLYNRNPG